jgi:hypothetical protein
VPQYTAVSLDENGNYQLYYGNSFLRLRNVDVSGMAADGVEAMYDQVVNSIAAQTNGEVLSKQLVSIHGMPACLVELNMYTVPARLLLYYADNQPGMLEASYLDLDGNADQADQVMDTMIHTLAAAEG